MQLEFFRPVEAGMEWNEKMGILCPAEDGSTMTDGFCLCDGSRNANGFLLFYGCRKKCSAGMANDRKGKQLFSVSHKLSGSFRLAGGDALKSLSPDGSRDLPMFQEKAPRRFFRNLSLFAKISINYFSCFFQKNLTFQKYCAILRYVFEIGSLVSRYSAV